MTDKIESPICGIVMPISPIDGCDETHWSDVLEILSESIEIAGYKGDLVSNSDDVGVIHKRIIQNLYDNPIVVCDVSGKNPNVMFELGLRLAFDKPTIIIKDDATAYSFDTSAIEHLEYPRDLRFNKIVEFKKRLAGKIKATYEKSVSDPNYTTFLKHFGEFKVAKLEKKEVSGQEYIIEELRGLRKTVARLEGGRFSSRNRLLNSPYATQEDKDFNICGENMSQREFSLLVKKLKGMGGIARLIIEDRGDHKHLLFDVESGANLEEIADLVEKYESEMSKTHRSKNAAFKGAFN